MGNHGTKRSLLASQETVVLSTVTMLHISSTYAVTTHKTEVLIDLFVQLCMQGLIDKASLGKGMSEVLLERDNRLLFATFLVESLPNRNDRTMNVR